MTNIMSYVNYEKLKKKLTLLEEELHHNLKDIQEARSKGDLRENSEYSAAKSKESMLKKEIKHIQDNIKTAKVIEIELRNTISFGVTVVLKDIDTDESIEYTIVNEEDVDILNGKIPYNSAIARSIIGKKRGDICICQIPIGEKKYLVEDFYIKE